MKLRNKKTGEIVTLRGIMSKENRIFFRFEDNTGIFKKEYNSLADLNAEWEDYDELSYWYIDSDGNVLFTDLDGERMWEALTDERKGIGNYFETKEEAEKAVEKLKAVKRLKDKGFRLSAVVDSFFCLDIYITGDEYKELKDDLMVVFGGEE